MDGFSVLTTLRQSSDVPVVMLSGRAEEVDRVVGLELGADDYVVKPYSLRELVARIGARLRGRSRQQYRSVEQPAWFTALCGSTAALARSTSTAPRWA